MEFKFKNIYGIVSSISVWLDFRLFTCAVQSQVTFEYFVHAVRTGIDMLISDAMARSGAR